MLTNSGLLIEGNTNFFEIVGFLGVFNKWSTRASTSAVYDVCFDRDSHSISISSIFKIVFNIELTLKSSNKNN